jgi:hypothetical protein
LRAEEVDLEEQGSPIMEEAKSQNLTNDAVSDINDMTDDNRFEFQ